MKRMPWFAVIVAIVVAVGVSKMNATKAAPGAPVFVSAPCPAPPQPIPALKQAKCGRIEVPENWTRPDGRKITLSVAIIPSVAAAKKPDPIVWLAGGPGDDAITEIPMALAGKLNADHDVIFMSQRGTYTAQPKLTCESIDRWPLDTLDMPYDAPETGRAYYTASLACRKQVLARTQDIGAYNTLESANDLEALRVALGIDKWNVYGISYGTDFALTYMKEHPGGIRSVGIDGVFPPSVAGGVAAWTSAGEGIKAIFAACASQPACKKRYGDIGATWRRLVLQYEASPKTVMVDVPGHSGKVAVKISGGMLVQWTVSPGTHLAGKVPAAIDALAHGNFTPIASTWAMPKLDPNGIGVVANGIFFPIACGEWVPYETEAQVIATGRRAFPMFPLSILKNAPNLPFMRPNCRAFNLPPVSATVRSATRSSIPTLVVNAQYDAQTAASFGAYVAKTLSNSTVVTIPNVAHVAFGSPSEAANACAFAIAASFFDDPKDADTSCVKRVPPTKFEL
jgi:pimeloyl-ACP methyl ester carboxylesterase